MHVTRHALDLAAREVAAARDATFRATVHQSPGGDVQQAQDATEIALEHLEAALDRLVGMGAHLDRPPDDHEDPYHSLNRLMRLSTPAARQLLDVLREAVSAAETVDAERGDTLGDEVNVPSGEPRGTGWAETIHALTERLRLEIEGPRSRRGE